MALGLPPEVPVTISHYKVQVVICWTSPFCSDGLTLSREVPLVWPNKLATLLSRVSWTGMSQCTLRKDALYGHFCDLVGKDSRGHSSKSPQPHFSQPWTQAFLSGRAMQLIKNVVTSYPTFKGFSGSASLGAFIYVLFRPLSKHTCPDLVENYVLKEIINSGRDFPLLTNLCRTKTWLRRFFKINQDGCQHVLEWLVDFVSNHL